LFNLSLAINSAVATSCKKAQHSLFPWKVSNQLISIYENFQEGTLMKEAQSSKTQSTIPPLYIQSGGSFSGLKATFEAITIFIVFSAVMMIVYDRFSKRKSNLFGTKKTQVNPCHGCQYLGDDSHLRCALHPSTVLTKKAIDCQDYYPSANKKNLGA
jgi:hypothetical protein